MNRHFSAVLPVALLVALLAAFPARAEIEGPPILTPRVIADMSLDDLFTKLKDNAGTPAGGRIEQEILRRFSHSGSPTADLLLSWAVEAMDAKNYPLALDVLDQIIVIKPDFAEAWNKRATVFYLMDDYSASLADIRATLALEPRHFGALAGFGMILESLDRNAEAIRVFKRALEINPRLDQVKDALEKLEKATAGSDI
jgi:tetratricopeptide (TPR) repeat protein